MRSRSWHRQGFPGLKTGDLGADNVGDCLVDLRGRATTWGRMGRGITAAALAVLLIGCGGGSSGGSGGGLEFRVFWETRDTSPSAAALGNAFATTIPKSVNAVRITIAPSGGPASTGCCVAVLRGTQTFADRVLVLDGIAEGEHRVTLRGYATDFAPAEGVSGKCATTPPSAGVPCDARHVAAPSFASEGVLVAVSAGERTDAGDITLYSTPFPVDMTPAQDETVEGPSVAVVGAIVDAVADVAPGSIEVSIGPAGGALSPVVLDPLVACDDLAGPPTPTCSPGGALEVRGYRVSGASVPIAEGDATLEIVAANDAAAARGLDLSYGFVVGTTSSTTSTSTTTTTAPDSTTTTTLPSGSTTTLPSETTTTTTVSTTTSSTTSTLPAPRSCSVTFGIDEVVDLSAVSFEVDYTAAPGDFVGAGDTVQCAPSDGLTVSGVFNDQDIDRVLIAALITADVITAPTDLAVCDFLGSLPPIDLDFAISVREAFDETLAPVSVAVVVRSIVCDP